MSVSWNPLLYAKFSAQRSRPFYDLLDRMQDLLPHTVVDLGCGSGELTRQFLERWHGARVLGVDSSPEMLEIAQRHAVPGRLRFERGDIATWAPEAPVDLLFSNAALHWLPDHASLIPRLTAFVAPGGCLAVQMPNNFDAPSHQAVLGLCQRPHWRAILEPVVPVRHVEALSWYVTRLMELGFTVDAWRTEVQHILPGSAAVLEWLQGTTLRPILARLQETVTREDFLAELDAELRRAYPEGPDGTLFPFERIFFLARRREASQAQS